MDVALRSRSVSRLSCRGPDAEPEQRPCPCRPAGGSILGERLQTPSGSTDTDDWERAVSVPLVHWSQRANIRRGGYCFRIVMRVYRHPPGHCRTPGLMPIYVFITPDWLWSVGSRLGFWSSCARLPVTHSPIPD